MPWTQTWYEQATGVESKLTSEQFWDFHTANQEGIHALMFLFSDRGTPKSIRMTNGYSGHTYKYTKDVGSPVTHGPERVPELLTSIGWILCICQDSLQG